MNTVLSMHFKWDYVPDPWMTTGNDIIQFKALITPLGSNRKSAYIPTISGSYLSVNKHFFILCSGIYAVHRIPTDTTKAP